VPVDDDEPLEALEPDDELLDDPQPQSAISAAQTAAAGRHLLICLLTLA